MLRHEPDSCSARGCPAWGYRAATTLFAFALQAAHALEPISDQALAAIDGRDGLNFNLSGLSIAGPAVLTYTAPNGSALQLSNFLISRSDDTAHTFTDPYSISLLRRDGGSDVISFANPTNSAGLARWQFATDLAVTANGTTANLGSLMLQDVAAYGGGWQFSTPQIAGVEGVAFGAAFRYDVGALAWRPRGRDNGSDELRVSGVRFGAVTSDGTFTGAPWQMADVTSQPGLFRAMTDANGPAIRIGIDWSASPGTAQPMAGLAIDSIRFTNDVTGTIDFGSSRFATMQLQYIDMRLRPGN